MNMLKLRRLLISIHLYSASLLAPVFLLVAISGGLYLADVKGEMKETPVAVPAGTAFDSKSPNFEADVRKFLQAQNLPSDFDYIRARGDSFTTRPSSQPHFTFEQKDGTVTAKRIDPSLLASLLEIHKGHGPEIYRLFGALAGLMLFVVVMGGLTIGLISAAYRKQTLISLAAGSTIFAYIAFFA